MAAEQDETPGIRQRLGNLRGEALVSQLLESLEQMEGRIALLEGRLEMVAAYERHRGPLTQSAPAGYAVEQPLADHHEIVAEDHLLLSDGFHKIQLTGEGGAYRWAAGSGGLPFSFFVDRSRPLQLSLTLFNTVDERNYSAMTLTDGANKLPLRFARRGKVADVTATLPERPGPDETRLVFQVPHFGKLSERDNRQAGVAFHRLVVAPATGGTGAAATGKKDAAA